jgi:hypothetical protein
MKKIAFLFFVLALACTRSQPQTFFVGPTDNHIRITGRVQHGMEVVTLYWSGTSIQVRFSGTSLKAKLRDERGENYFNVVIDGDSLRYIKLGTKERLYELASALEPGEHTVELIKRNEWDRGKTWFYGFEVAGKLHELPEKNKRLIEFFGNSISAGYAIEDLTGGDSPDGTYTNNYYTYAALTARHFNADLHCTVKSGIGIMVSWFPLIMPEMYNRLDPTDQLSRWDFKSAVPDIVVVNLFQNDSWLMQKPDHPEFKMRFGDKAPTDIEIIKAYASFIKKIRTVYADAHIICALGPMDAVRDGAPWPGYISKAVLSLNDKKIYTHFFPFTQKNGHPRIDDNKKMAESLIDFIDKNIW